MEDEFVRVFVMGELFLDEDDGWPCQAPDCGHRSNAIALTKADLEALAMAMPRAVYEGDDFVSITGPAACGYILTEQLGKVFCAECLPKPAEGRETEILRDLIAAGKVTLVVDPEEIDYVVRCPHCQVDVGGDAAWERGDQKDTFRITCTNCHKEWDARIADFRRRGTPYRGRNPFTPVLVAA